jgi:preprotein translocase subunit SecG
MLSGLLITINILVCISLVAVVLLQRSEGGAFGMGGGPTGLITTRGAGDLLTRTTWVLFGLFLALSLALTLIGAHDKATSSVIEKLKLQQANPNALNQPVAPAAPIPTAPLTTGAPAQTAPSPGALLAPQPPAPAQAAPVAAAAPKPAHAAASKHPATGAPATPAPAASQAQPPILLAPPPPAPASPAPATGTP